MARKLYNVMFQGEVLWGNWDYRMAMRVCKMYRKQRGIMATIEVA